jgi:hypothetical protein
MVGLFLAWMSPGSGWLVLEHQGTRAHGKLKANPNVPVTPLRAPGGHLALLGWHNITCIHHLRISLHLEDSEQWFICLIFP